MSLDASMVWNVIEQLIALLIIMDPLGALPVFWFFTEKLPEKRRDVLATKTMILAAIVATVFLFLGLRILSLFGVSLASFKVAGGIVLLIMGIQMTVGLLVKQGEERAKTYQHAIVPVAIPLLAGPGMITTLILFVGTHGYISTAIALVLALAIIWGVFRNARSLLSIFGRQGSDAISRLMGMLIIAFAVQFIKEGWQLL